MVFGQNNPFGAKNQKDKITSPFHAYAIPSRAFPVPMMTQNSKSTTHVVK